MRSIVVVDRGDANSARALDWAQTWARPDGQQVRAVPATDPGARQQIVDASRQASVVIVARGEPRPDRVAIELSELACGPLIVLPDPAPSAPMAGPFVAGADGSPEAYAAIEYALEQAQQRAVGVEVVVATGDLAEQTRSPRTDRIVAEVGLLRQARPAVPVRLQVTDAHPVTTLIDRSADAALLVVANRGLGGATGLALGSTARALVIAAKCPVVVLRSNNRTESEDQPERIPLL